jgi:hypothetical protein
MVAPLTVVCWRWQTCQGYRTSFAPESVRILRNMVRRHYPHPHRFLCVTDSPDEIDADIETHLLWPDFATVHSPHGSKHPSCYRRLRAFHPEIAAIFGPRFVSIDLDVVLTADVTPLWQRSEDFVCYGTAGARPQVWTRFNPQHSPQQAKRAGCFGSDQGWMTHVLGPHEAMWTQTDGVYSFRNHLRGTPTLPADARMVMFHGGAKPWDPQVQQSVPWLSEHYL